MVAEHTATNRMMHASHLADAVEEGAVLHVPDFSQVLAAPDASLQPRPVVALDSQENAV